MHKRTPSPEKAAPVSPSKRSKSPPVTHIPPPIEPVSAASTEDRLMRNVEEEMMAAEMLQQIMDAEPSHDMDPVIHIPEREDASYSDDGADQFESQFVSRSRPENDPMVLERVELENRQPIAPVPVMQKMEREVKEVRDVEQTFPPHQHGMPRTSSEAQMDELVVKRMKSQKEEEMRQQMMNIPQPTINFNQNGSVSGMDMENQVCFFIALKCYGNWLYTVSEIPRQSETKNNSYLVKYRKLFKSQQMIFYVLSCFSK